MKLLPLAAVLSLLALPAMAQNAIAPLRTEGCATMSVTNSSTVLSAANVTALPTSTFPPSDFGRTLYVEADYGNSANVTFCQFGGTCSTSAGAGVTMGPGASRTLRVPFITVPPTVIAASGTQKLFVCWMMQ